MIATSTVSPSLRIGLRFLGVWPDARHPVAYRLIYMSSILIVQYFQYLYVFSHLKLSEFLNLVDGLPATLDYTLTLLKLATLWTHRRVILEILAAMDDDWRECAGIERHLYAMTIKAGISHLCSNAMMGFNTIAGVLYLLGDYAIRFSAEENNETLRQFPIKIEFPFEVEHSPMYELLVVFLFVHVLLNTYTVAILNSLIFTLVLHASGQIDIICQEFRTISEKTPTYRSSVSALGMLIERHNRVITFSDNIDKLFSFMALMQVIWDTLVICCLGFVVIISIRDEIGVVPIVKTVFAYFAILMEIFVFCFAGEYLSLKSKSIANAAYESLWYKMSLDQSKVVSFIIMRSQRQLTITAGRVTNLSLEAFASIMKASASYISVLHAMY